jgi:hypothetical protein
MDRRFTAIGILLVILGSGTISAGDIFDRQPKLRDQMGIKKLAPEERALLVEFLNLIDSKAKEPLNNDRF